MQELKKLYFKTKKDAPSDEVSLNAKLLIRGGFIYKEMAGVYAYLPLGLRVFEKIKNIIKDEMEKIDAREMVMTSLQRKELWEKTDRWTDEAVDVWFKTKLKNESEIGLAWSHEEPITDMMRGYINSYKDLPAYVYQFQTKLRNETRAKSGIMRTREFVMKDLYSYSLNEEEHKKFYDKATQAYHNVFKRVGVGDITYFTFASGGAFTKFSHEFQTICEAGEDIVYIDEEKRIAINQEVYNDEVLELLKVDKNKLVKKKTAEVGNIFSFGTDKCEKIGLYFNNEKGEKTAVTLGSYGIGLGRLMGVVVEVFNDEKGIKWPFAIAPYHIHIVVLSDKLIDKAKTVGDQLEKLGYEVLIDTSEDKAGEKFANADLIGCPLRIVISEKNSQNNELELKLRSEDSAIIIKASELLEKVKSLLPYEDNSKS